MGGIGLELNLYTCLWNAIEEIRLSQKLFRGQVEIAHIPKRAIQPAISQYQSQFSREETNPKDI